MKPFFKGLASAFCIIGLIVYTSMLLFPDVSPDSAEVLKDSRSALIFMDILLILFLYLLNRKKSNAMYRSNQNLQSVSSYLPEIPAETLRTMKRYYTAPQIQNDLRIMQESFQLVQQTTDFDTFFMRLELSQQKALTLLQAVQAGCRGITNKPQLIKNCEAVLSTVQAAKIVFLDNSYKKETTSAMQLKTKSGQYKRLTAYLERLKSYKDRFWDAEDTYNQTVNALQDLIAECRPSDKKPEAHVKAKSTADEIMKFKQLLDAGAITQEEYDLKKSQLLSQ